MITGSAALAAGKSTVSRRRARLVWMLVPLIVAAALANGGRDGAACEYRSIFGRWNFEGPKWQRRRS